MEARACNTGSVPLEPGILALPPHANSRLRGVEIAPLPAGEPVDFPLGPELIKDSIDHVKFSSRRPVTVGVVHQYQCSRARVFERQLEAGQSMGTVDQDQVEVTGRKLAD